MKILSLILILSIILSGCTQTNENNIPHDPSEFPDNISEKYIQKYDITCYYYQTGIYKSAISCFDGDRTSVGIVEK